MNTDLYTPPTEPPGLFDRALLTLINDERDLPFVHLILGCLSWAAVGVGLFFSGPYLWYLAPVYLAVWALVFLDRFILMLHCTSHRMLFKKEHGWMNQLIPWAVGPFFGETPETYFSHHMGMHHPENNLHDDLSTTMPYRRDSLAAWLHYYFSFLFTGLARLAKYHLEHGNRKMFTRTVVGEGIFILACVGLAMLNPGATLVVFVVPVVLVRLLMMAGNWGQHAFVDGSDPANAYKNSITCINTRYNKRCFNDGYHIHHHVRARTHWSELPAEFESNKAEYGRQDAIVFEGVDFFQVWMMLMLKRWDALADRFVQLPGAPVRDRTQIIEFLQSRVQPIPAATLTADPAPAE
jgi:fatty acid desaturase